ncbi:hypothetical protein [Calycomorphotria hydatis]|uniref:Uncharacterized protein n=1 Tax=Calycomorphotria hydatis TaxID=2528027 RepID=A0A517T8F8_9PLAN|nr:hypothetical protein [Calycomorphotria hydatis]QDT64639.1 hypothetical protein V22_18790 [Calycomorphotria hydatis]
MNREAGLALSMLFTSCTFLTIGVLLIAESLAPVIAGGLLISGSLAMIAFTCLQYIARNESPALVPVKKRDPRSSFER